MAVLKSVQVRTDCCHSVCPQPATVPRWEQTQGGLPSAGLVEHLDFQEALKPTSIPGSHVWFSS